MVTLREYLRHVVQSCKGEPAHCLLSLIEFFPRLSMSVRGFFKECVEDGSMAVCSLAEDVHLLLDRFPSQKAVTWTVH